jgi:hypothetical protein
MPPGVPRPSHVRAHRQGSEGRSGLAGGQHGPLSPLEDLIHDLLLKIGAHSQIDPGLADRAGIHRDKRLRRRLLGHD